MGKEEMKLGWRESVGESEVFESVGDQKRTDSWTVQLCKLSEKRGQSGVTLRSPSVSPPNNQC